MSALATGEANRPFDGPRAGGGDGPRGHGLHRVERVRASQSAQFFEREAHRHERWHATPPGRRADRAERAPLARLLGGFPGARRVLELLEGLPNLRRVEEPVFVGAAGRGPRSAPVGWG